MPLKSNSILKFAVPFEIEAKRIRKVEIEQHRNQFCFRNTCLQYGAEGFKGGPRTPRQYGAEGFEGGPRTPRQYGAEGFEGGPQLGPHYCEMREPLLQTADNKTSSQDKNFV